MSEFINDRIAGLLKEAMNNAIRRYQRVLDNMNVNAAKELAEEIVQEVHIATQSFVSRRAVEKGELSDDIVTEMWKFFYGTLKKRFQHVRRREVIRRTDPLGEESFPKPRESTNSNYEQWVAGLKLELIEGLPTADQEFLEALKQHDGNLTALANMLGQAPSTPVRRLKKIRTKLQKQLRIEIEKANGK